MDSLRSLLTRGTDQRTVSQIYVLVVRDRQTDRSRLWKVLRDELGPAHPLENRVKALSAQRDDAWAEFERSHGYGHDQLELQEHTAVDMDDFRERYAALRVNEKNPWSP